MLVKRNVIPTLWLIVCTILLLSGSGRTEEFSDLAELYERNTDDIYELVDKTNRMIDNQNKFLKLINQLTTTTEVLHAQISDATTRAALAEKLVISLRSDTFNLKAQIVQLRGEVAELRKEDKGWFK